MNKTKNILQFIGSFLLPFSLLLILWHILQLAPFGDYNLLVSDLGTQYLPFLSEFKTMLANGELHFYSFANDIGDSLLSLSAYYLLSPFNFLVAFFDYADLPVAILWIITLKIATIGTSMFYYLKKHYHRTSWLTLAFSTAYSLSGFVVAYSLNFMWLDALIFLPLITLGLEKLYHNRQIFLYCVSLFLGIVTNFYLGYMMCLYAVCYLIYLDYQENGWQSVKFFWQRTRLFWGSSFLTGMATSFVLVPAVVEMMQTKKTDFQWTTFLPYPTFGIGFFSQFGVGMYQFDIRLAHLPTVFSGILILLLVVLYFFNPTIDKKKKYSQAGLLLALFISFWIETANTLWHMFQSPAGFPYRNTFIFSFLLIKLAYESALAFNQQTKASILPLLKKATLTISGLLVLGNLWLLLLRSDYLLSINYLWLSLALLLGYAGLLYLRFLQPRKVLTVLVLALTCFELGFNYWVSLKDIAFGSQAAFATNYRQEKELLNRFDMNEICRIKQTTAGMTDGYQETNNGYNNSLLYNYGGMSSYTSTLRADSQETLTKLGLYAKNDRRIAYVENSPVINLLFDTAYQIVPDKNGQPTMLANDEAIGMGFTVTDEFATIPLKEQQPLTNQEALLQGILPQKQGYLLQATVTEEKQTKHSTTLTITPQSTGELFAYFPYIQGKNVESWTINNQKKRTPMVIQTNEVLSLGQFKKGEEVTLTVTGKKAIDLSDGELATLDSKTFTRLIDTKQSEGMELTKTGSNQYTGDLTLKESASRTLYLSVPINKNWQITVNGEPVKATQAVGNLMTLPVNPGENHISLTYRPQSLVIGGWISLISILIGIVYGVYGLFRRNRFQNTN